MCRFDHCGNIFQHYQTLPEIHRESINQIIIYIQFQTGNICKCKLVKSKLSPEKYCRVALTNLS